MSGVAIRIGLDGILEAEHLLDRLSALGEDMSELMEALGGAMADATVERFELEVSPGGSPWLPSRRVQTFGGQTLNDHGHLKLSFTTPEAWHAGPKAVEWGTNIEYAAIHQFGGTISAKDGGLLFFTGADGQLRSVPSVTIPARPFLGFSADDERRAVEIVADFIEQAVSAAGGAP